MALRMFRREWRQQALILSLLTVAVAASIGIACAAYTTTPVPDNAVRRANHLVKLASTDPQVSKPTSPLHAPGSTPTR